MKPGASRWPLGLQNTIKFIVLFTRSPKHGKTRDLGPRASANANRLASAGRDPASLWSFCNFTFTGRNRLQLRKQEIEMLDKLAGSRSEEAKRFAFAEGQKREERKNVFRIGTPFGAYTSDA